MLEHGLNITENVNGQVCQHYTLTMSLCFLCAKRRNLMQKLRAMYDKVNECSSNKYSFVMPGQNKNYNKQQNQQYNPMHVKFLNTLGVHLRGCIL